MQDSIPIDANYWNPVFYEPENHWEQWTLRFWRMQLLHTVIYYFNSQLYYCKYP